MSQNGDCVFVADAIGRLHAAAGLPWPPPANRAVVPVPLDRLIATYNLTHAEVSGLTCAVAGLQLERWGVHRPELLEEKTPLAGFLFVNASGGYILVRADDPLPRRRFTAAHELGHYLLHFLPGCQAENNTEAYLVRDEEGNLADDKSLSLPVMERQANQFAAELLIPEAVCRQTSERFDNDKFRATDRYLEHHLASHLLVSREAVRWRLRNLGLTH